jgi:transcriptional regulator with XRE-family HTH domain
MPSRESLGQRIKRLRLERGLSQRELSAPGVSYAYISRVEVDARTPSVKALRRITNKLGVTVEHLETGKPTPTELGVADAGLDFGSLTKAEVRSIRAAAADSARDAAQRAAEQVTEERKGSRARPVTEKAGRAG